VTVAERLAASGDLLFRWRSYLPLLLLPLFVASLADTNSHPSPLWQACCLAVALAGLAVRVLVVGSAPPGTSERGTRRPTAALLNTRGAYSLVRHPLYLANGLIYVGLSLIPGVWYLPTIVALASLLYFERIAAREEAFLLEQFGAQFTEWAAEVPAVIPRFSQYRPASTAFDTGKALTQEAHGLFAIVSAVFVLDSVKASFAVQLPVISPTWLPAFLLTGLILLGATIVKKRRAAKPTAQHP
jgi:protein-S-isoprenylcysteine O-methyltransferase Ste14